MSDKEFDIFAILKETIALMRLMSSTLAWFFIAFFLLSFFSETSMESGIEGMGAGAFLLLLFISFTFTFFFTGTLIATVWGVMNNNENPLKDGVNRCSQVFTRYVGASLLSMIFIFAGLLLLIVPGIIVAIALMLVGPVVIVENPGIVDSLKRSHELTDGYKLKISILVLLLAGVIALISLLVYATSGFEITATTQVVTLFINSLMTIFSIVLYTVIYRYLSQKLQGAELGA